MNLHAAVRGQVTIVNPDTVGTWRRSNGATTALDGSRTPVFVDVPNTLFQIQALTGKDLKHLERLNIQDVERAVYMYGNAQGAVRVDAKGGDLLLFPQVRGGAAFTWLVVAVLETWTPDVSGWCKLGVKLQVD